MTERSESDNESDNEYVVVERRHLNYLQRGCEVYVRTQEELNKMREHIEVTYCGEPNCFVFDIELPSCLYESSPGYQYERRLTNGYCDNHGPHN